jgi:GT2 family glycosyltransferase
LISLVFLTYNRLGITARCLSSLADTLRRDDVEWIILDNGSTDGTANWLRLLAAQYPGEVRISLQARNTGVAGGRAILYAMARGDVIISMDSDVEARRAGWLDRLLAPLKDDGIWLCGPGGAFVERDWSDFRGAHPGKPGSVDVCAGFCQAFKRPVLEAAGIALDQAYNPRWHEDSDLSLQIRAAGGEIYHTGDIGLFHVFAHTGDDGSGATKHQRLISKWAGRGLVAAERESA